MFLVLEILPEGKLKCIGLTALRECISRQPSIDCDPWLLVVILRCVYNENIQAVQKEINNKIIQF